MNEETPSKSSTQLGGEETGPEKGTIGRARVSSGGHGSRDENFSEGENGDETLESGVKRRRDGKKVKIHKKQRTMALGSIQEN